MLRNIKYFVVIVRSADVNLLNRGQFWRLEYRLSEDLMFFHFVFKQNLYEKAFCDVKTKDTPHFAVKNFQGSDH